MDDRVSRRVRSVAARIPCEPSNHGGRKYKLNEGSRTAEMVCRRGGQSTVGWPVVPIDAIHLSLVRRILSTTPRQKKPKLPEPPDDEIRERILRFLYDTHKAARSADSTYATMGEIKKAMKSLNVMEKRIVSNLTYLAQNRWVEQDTVQFLVHPKGRPVMTRKVRYRIASAGIDRYEGPSPFQRVERMSGINITNIQGVTVVGHDNVVNARFMDLYKSLDALGSEIRASEQLDDRQKLTYQAEIETIKSQLMKDQPDPTILGKAWEVLKGVATISGVAIAAERVHGFLKAALGLG